MLKRHSLSLMLVVLSLLIALAGCSDDDPTEPEPAFSVTVAVTTPDGDPVAGLRGALSPDLDIVRWPYDKARDLPPATPPVSLLILDVAGDLVRTLIAEGDEQPGPPYQLHWNGLDDDGEAVHDGVYFYVITYEVDGELVEETMQMVLISGDPDACAAGVTDADGRFVVHDRTYVPAFYDIGPLVSIDEEGNVTGTETITTRTRLTLLADSGEHQVVVFEAEPTAQTVTVTWDPQP